MVTDDSQNLGMRIEMQYLEYTNKPLEVEVAIQG